MMKRLSKAQLDELLTVQLGWLRDLLLKWWNYVKEFQGELTHVTLGPVMEGVVGVALIVMSVAVVIFLICLCWGIVWKLLLSRLGLFRELVSNNGNGERSNVRRSNVSERRPRSILMNERSWRQRPRRSVEIREPAEIIQKRRESGEEDIDVNDVTNLAGEMKSRRRRGDN